jgi:hypothetical protein
VLNPGARRPGQALAHRAVPRPSRGTASSTSRALRARHLGPGELVTRAPSSRAPGRPSLAPPTDLDALLACCRRRQRDGRGRYRPRCTWPPRSARGAWGFTGRPRPRANGPLRRRSSANAVRPARRS